jgi:ribosomal-protein-alanine N-acetyltransferase
MATFYVRWMIRNDLPQVMEIENAVFPSPWTEDEFRTSLRCRDIVGLVASNAEMEVYAYMVYWLRRRHIVVLNLAVDPALQRLGLGSAMLEKLQTKLSSRRRTRIIADVCEDNLGAHLFFRANGWPCIEIVREKFEDYVDMYRFEWSLSRYRWYGQAARNRVSRFLSQEVSDVSSDTDGWRDDCGG